MPTGTTLSDAMRERANADNLPLEHELRLCADAFDSAAEGFYAQPQTTPVAKFMGAWARARKSWCTYTGEPLL